ncbi:MAG: folate family ECF transporter S component [Oscillospiraceae bacterium]|nr:folate family ECF transporter S component [Oscillospiraceae bacterium]
MMSFFSMFGTSFKEFRNVRTVLITGLFIAVSMVLEMFSINLALFKINFAFLAIAVIGMLFGPSVGLIAGMLCDIVGFIAKPDGGFYPAYVLVAGLQGLIYGICLYHRMDPQLRIFKQQNSMVMLCIRAVIARLLDVVIINLLLNTALNLHYGFIPAEAYGTAVIARTAKNVLELGADIPLLMIILPAALAAFKRMGTIRTARS